MKPGSKPAKPVKPEPGCPCGRAASYSECCGRYHAGLPAPTAEALMRSRYSAYVLGMGNYLLQTWAEETRPTSLDVVTPPQPKWLGLDVLRQREDGDTAGVEFIARCRINGRAERLHEYSRFTRRYQRWFYVDANYPSDI